MEQLRRASIPSLQRCLGEVHSMLVLRSIARDEYSTSLSDTWDCLRTELPDTSGVLRYPDEAAGQLCANLQKELTGLRETKRFRDLDVAVRALPTSDIRPAASVNCDKFSTTWVSTWPSTNCRVSNPVFVEIAACYFGCQARQARRWEGRQS